MVNTGNRLVNFWQKFGKQWELESLVKVAVSSDLQLKIQVSRSTAGRGARPHAQIFIFLDQRLQCAVVLQIDFRSGVHVL